ncbi:MAG TPA: HrcA family transcriptional regulator, partial [Holophaga sp.]|nr:HrcA family transcriptional regulator [Holophaga sp.]
RYYVNRWVKRTPPEPGLGAKLSATFEGMDQDPDIWLRHASRVLAEVMGGICLALPFHLTRSRLMRLEFHLLGNRRLVAIWIGTAGDVEHQVMDNLWSFSAETLTELGNFATEHFRGCTLLDMRQRLVDTLRLQADEAHQLLERLSALAAHMTDASERENPAVVVAGLGELGRMPEFEDSRRFRELVQAFEEHQRLARLLNAFAEASAEEVKLLLGSENPYLQDMPLATAVRTVSLPGDSNNITFALVGPLRMDYVRLLGGLSWWSDEIHRRLPPSV